MLKNLIVAAGTIALAGAPMAADGPAGSIVGDYVEARTAEVFVGGCQLGNEGEAAGRQAVLAWRVHHGSYGGIPLDGLAIVAAVAADTNLGYHELGARRPSIVKAAVMVDERANPAQRLALMGLARSLSNGLVSDVVDVKPVAIDFSRDADHVRVTAGDAALAVATKMEHDPTCGAQQWYSPLSQVTDAEIGITRRQGYTGTSLGVRWQQLDRRSAFFGRFVH